MVSGFDQVLQTSPAMVRLSGPMSNGNHWSHMLGMLCLHPFSWLAFRFSEYWAFHIRPLILTRSVAVSPPWYLVLPQLLSSTSLSRFPRVSHGSPFNRSVTSLVFDLKRSLAPWAAISSLAISSLPRPSVSSNSALLALDKHSIRYACSATSSPRESFFARGVGHLLCPGAPPGQAETRPACGPGARSRCREASRAYTSRPASSGVDYVVDEVTVPKFELPLAFSDPRFFFSQPFILFRLPSSLDFLPAPSLLPKFVSSPTSAPPISHFSSISHRNNDRSSSSRL